MTIEQVAAKYNLTPDEARIEHALQLVVSQQSRCATGGGTWQTWDWIRRQILAIGQGKMDAAEERPA